VRVYVPLRVGDAPQRFALGVVMPHAVIVAEARQLLWLTLLVGVVAALTQRRCLCAAAPVGDPPAGRSRARGR
jgi:hypothetical protein